MKHHIYPNIKDGDCYEFNMGYSKIVNKYIKNLKNYDRNNNKIRFSLM